MLSPDSRISGLLKKGVVCRGVECMAAGFYGSGECVSDRGSGSGGIAKRQDRGNVSGMELAEVTCPTCFEVFEVGVPHPDEMPAEVDYDCEVCCRPMTIVFTEDEVYARGLAD